MHRFEGGAGGFDAASPLLLDSSGALYGTTVSGGQFGLGTAFKLVGKQHTVIHSFAGGEDDGAEPYAELVFGADGNLYGTTVWGRDYTQGYGTVFKLSPRNPPSTKWNSKVIYRFQGGLDGGLPGSPLIFDDGGALYGTASAYGSCCGTVFKLTPGTGNQWNFEILYRFAGGADGSGPNRLVFDKAGALYGTTYWGGFDSGTVFKLSPPASDRTTWTENVLYRFTGFRRGGEHPAAGVIFGNDGALYGTTYFGGGPCNCGTVDFGACICATRR